MTEARRGWRPSVVAMLLVVSSSLVSQAQSIDGARAALVSPRNGDSTRRPESLAAGGETPMRISSRLRPFAPLASAIVPGSGQLALGNDRFVAYAAVEFLGWWKYLKDTREQAVQERTYKELARSVGRRNFSTTLPDGDWTYYEAMRDWLESGVYSKTLTGPVEPETDTTTFNGHQWDLARRTTPDRASALAQYERTAITPDLRWSWRNAQLQYDIFKRTTFKRDDAYYAAVQDIIVIGANHVISMIDAFATVRLQVRTDADGRTAIGARVQW